VTFLDQFGGRGTADRCGELTYSAATPTPRSTIQTVHNQPTDATECDALTRIRRRGTDLDGDIVVVSTSDGLAIVAADAGCGHARVG
jgi:hypothetical protein